MVALILTSAYAHATSAAGETKIIHANSDYLLPLSRYFSVIVLLKLKESQSRTIYHIQSEFLVTEKILQNFSFYKTFC